MSLCMFLANSETPETVIRDDRDLEGQRCHPAGANQGPSYEPESPDSSCPGLLLAPSPSFSEKDKRVGDLPKSHGQCGKAVGLGQTHGRGTNTKGPSKTGDGAQTERERASVLVSRSNLSWPRTSNRSLLWILDPVSDMMWRPVPCLAVKGAPTLTLLHGPAPTQDGHQQLRAC